MPNRILYEKVCTSDTIAQLSAEEERFFYRLMVQCDDFGRFDGRPMAIRSRCFAVQVDSVSDDDVARWLEGLVKVGLVTQYEADGRPYLQMVTFIKHQPPRAKKSRWPDPQHESEDDAQESASTCEQTPANVPVFDIRSSISGVRSSESEVRDSATTPQPPPFEEGEFPPTPRKRGAIKKRGSDAPAVAVETQPVDMANWVAANDRLRPDMNASYFENVIESLVCIGRGSDGGMLLRAPPGMAPAARRFQKLIIRALADVGDPAPNRVAIVE